MNKRLLFFSFLSCVIISIVIESLLLSSKNNGTFIGFFFLLLFNWKVESIILHFVIYALSFYVIYRLVESSKSVFSFYLLLILFDALYLISIIIFDWNLSKDIFSSFQEYMTNGNHYLIYSFIVVLLTNFLGVTNFKKLQQKRSNL